MDTDFDTAMKSLKAAAEPTRLRLLALCARGERSVSELTDCLGQSQPRISRHLKVLTEAGLLERFRDGHWVFFRAPCSGERGRLVQQILGLVPQHCATLARDRGKLQATTEKPAETRVSTAGRAFNRAVLDYSLSGPIGRLLDIGAGEARILKLLGASASEAVGIDINPELRHSARQLLRGAGLTNCSIRAGDMYRMHFAAASFDTVVLDEVLLAAERPAAVFAEATRVLAPGGRVIVIEALSAVEDKTTGEAIIAAAARSAGIRIGRARAVPPQHSDWLFFSGVSSSNARHVA